MLIDILELVHSKYRVMESTSIYLESTGTKNCSIICAGTSKIKITFIKTTVKPRGSYSQLPPLEVPQLPDALRPPSNTGSGEFEVTYLDSDTRITRGDRGELRVFVIS